MVGVRSITALGASTLAACLLATGTPPAMADEVEQATGTPDFAAAKQAKVTEDRGWKPEAVRGEMVTTSFGHETPADVEVKDVNVRDQVVEVTTNWPSSGDLLLNFNASTEDLYELTDAALTDDATPLPLQSVTGTLRLAENTVDGVHIELVQPVALQTDESLKRHFSLEIDEMEVRQLRCYRTSTIVDTGYRYQTPPSNMSWCDGVQRGTVTEVAVEHQDSSSGSTYEPTGRLRDEISTINGKPTVHVAREMRSTDPDSTFHFVSEGVAVPEVGGTYLPHEAMLRPESDSRSSQWSKSTGAGRDLIVHVWSLRVDASWYDLAYGRKAWPEASVERRTVGGPGDTSLRSSDIRVQPSAGTTAECITAKYEVRYLIWPVRYDREANYTFPENCGS